MDRRQRKTREAIFRAFTELLADKEYEKITVGEIIEKADIGRATFYAHFETKDFLLRELCDELFCHVFDAAHPTERDHRHIFDCEAPDSVFLHLLLHLGRNDNGVLNLLSCRNDRLFLQYFKEGLKALILEQCTPLRCGGIPQEYVVNHIAATFVETVSFWVMGGRKESAETLAGYFSAAVKPFLNSGAPV